MLAHDLSMIADEHDLNDSFSDIGHRLEGFGARRIS